MTEFLSKLLHCKGGLEWLMRTWLVIWYYTIIIISKFLAHDNDFPAF